MAAARSSAACKVMLFLGSHSGWFPFRSPNAEKLACEAYGIAVYGVMYTNDQKFPFFCCRDSVPM